MVEQLELEEKEEYIKERQKKNFDKRHRARELPQLEPGDTVWIPDRDSSGTVVEETSPRSHIVKTADGSYRRNRRHLIRMPETESSQEEEVLVEEQPSRLRSTRISKLPDRYDPSWT